MKLNEKDQITYLANVIFIAHADGPPSSEETAAIERVRLSLGAKKSALDAATKLVLSRAYIPQKLASFVAETSNFADLLYVSVIDGDLSESEKSIITELSKSTSLTDQQLMLLTREAINRAKSGELSVICPSCKTTIQSDSVFCAKCGHALASIQRSELQIPTSGYAIEFCESTSASFPEALKVAQAAPSFSSCIRNKKAWYLAAWPDSKIEPAIELADLLSGIRNRKCYHNGAELRWDELFGFVWCASERNKAYRPDKYCFGKEDSRLNPWGCMQARLEWTEWARWFSFGRFEKAGFLRGNAVVWIFDKQRIRHELMSNLHRVRYCPYLRPSLVEAVLESLPEKVEINENGIWKYGQSYEETPGSIKIVETDRSDGFEFKREYYADGVRPRGLRSIEEILRSAFEKARINDLQIAELIQ